MYEIQMSLRLLRGNQSQFIISQGFQNVFTILSINTFLIINKQVNQYFYTTLHRSGPGLTFGVEGDNRGSG
jgi:hypothetical protein